MLISTYQKVDNFISLIFVTPHMHKIHHHYKQPLTDTNYGNIFQYGIDYSVHTDVVDQKSIVYGRYIHE